MARSNYQYEKRRKELAKKKKIEEKHERKLAKKNSQTPEVPDSATGEEETEQPGLASSLLTQQGEIGSVPGVPSSLEDRVD